MSNRPKPRAFKEALRNAKLPERTVRICLRADLIAEHEKAERELNESRSQTLAQTLGTSAAEVKLARRVEELQAEMESESHTFTVRALPRAEYRALTRAHPPRDGEAADKSENVNLETYPDALIRACVVDPVLDEEDWEAFAEVMTSRTFDDLYLAALLVNRGEADVPFSQTASRVIRLSDGGHKRPEPTE